MEPTSGIGTLSPWEPGILPLIVYGLLVLVLMAIFLFLSSWLGEKRTHPEKLRPFESGIIPTGSAQSSLSGPLLSHCHIFPHLRCGGCLYFLLGHRF